MNPSKRLAGMGLLLLLCACCVSCAGRTYLMVDYSVPPATDELNGQTVRIAVADERSQGPVMTPEAASRFTAFNNRYSLAWVTPGRPRTLAGEHDLLGALYEAFKKRLTRMGATVTLRSQPDIPVLSIALTRMTLDLQNRQWAVDLSYTASLVTGPDTAPKETVSGHAERVRVVGRKGADMVLSDIFSDTTNRLDLVKMFRQAGLIQ
jgi:hypothetical protein